MKTMDNFIKYHVTGALIILLCILAFCSGPARADTTQTNTSGSNNEQILHKQTLLDLTLQLKVDMNQLLQLPMNQVLSLHQQLAILQIQL